jgi:hypothetical protein
MTPAEAQRCRLARVRAGHHLDSAISGNTVEARLVDTAGRSFSVHVVNFTLAESLAGVSLFVPEMVRSLRLDPGSAWCGCRMSYGKESPWHREL